VEICQKLQPSCICQTQGFRWFAGEGPSKLLTQLPKKTLKISMSRIMDNPINGNCRGTDFMAGANMNSIIDFYSHECNLPSDQKLLITLNQQLGIPSLTDAEKCVIQINISRWICIIIRFLAAPIGSCISRIHTPYEIKGFVS
jgi:hypothetical protein